MTFINKARDFIALSIDPHTDHLIDMTRVTDIFHAHNQEIITILQDKHLFLDPFTLPITHSRFRSHSSTRKKPNPIQPPIKMTQLT